MNIPSEQYTCCVNIYLTFCICTASSRVGESIRDWVSRSWISTFCRTEMANVAVLPVPDWALQDYNKSMGLEYTAS